MLEYHHVDVFTDRPYAGNSLAVFVDQEPLDAAQMLAITQELRHFETIFVTRTSREEATARIFDLFEELPFAGHPTIGGAAVLHQLTEPMGAGPLTWRVELPARTVAITTARLDERTVTATLAQGAPEPLPEHAESSPDEVAAAVGLRPADLHPDLPIDVVSTGLRYLIVPVVSGALERARYTRADMDRFLADRGAQFCYLLDVQGLEGRHWNNDGLTEDVATGSAAGCIAAYLLRYGRAAAGQAQFLKQGRYAGRPSRMQIAAYGSRHRIDDVTVTGEVALLGVGSLAAVPSRADRSGS